MKKVKFDVIHRLVLLGIIDGESKEGHSLTELNKYLKLVDKIQFKEDEVKKFNLRIEDAAWKWQTKDADGKDIKTEKEFELNDEQTQLLRDVFKKKDEKKEFTSVNVAPIFHIAEAIDYKFE